MSDALAARRIPPSEKRLAAALEHRFYLRAHMSAMLIATLLAGLAATRLLAASGVNVFAVRYGVAVIVAYAVFIASVKLWLGYIALCAAAAARRAGTSKGGDDWFDCFNLSSSGSSSWSSSSSSSASSLSEGGGKFGGGGASGSWGNASPKTNVLAAAAAPPKHSSKSSSSSKKSSGGGGGGDWGELMLVVLIIALVVAVIASFAWMVWAAPTILSEAAFNAVLAGALAKHARHATRGNWVGSVMKKTMIPFALILILAILVGWWAQKVCPDARRLNEAVHCAHPVF